MLATSARTSLHLTPPSAGTIAFFAVFTVLWAVGIVRLRSFWNYEPPRITIDAQASVIPASILLTFRRQAPIAVIAAGFFICVGWLTILFTNDLWVIAPALLFGALTLVGLVLIASVWLFNRPRRLVPPHLRDLPGLLSKTAE
jgi:hypothetical protein